MLIPATVISARPATTWLGPYSIAYNTPGLTTGVTLYTPSAADVGRFLDQILIFADTAWDAAALADVGTFVGTTQGCDLADGGTGFDMAIAAIPGSGGTGLTRQGDLTVFLNGLPRLITGVNPLKIVVSTTAESGGADPGATAGAARVWLSIG